MSIYYNVINVAVWNIHGIFSYVNKVKICKLGDPEFKDYIKSLDILCLQETHVGPSETQSLTVEGFRIIPFHRKKSENNRFFGGSMLLIRKELMRGIKIIDSYGGDVIWLKLKKEFFGLEKDLLFCFAYVPPSTSPYTKTLGYEPLDKIEEDISRFKIDNNFILADDFNAKTNTVSDFVSDINDKHSPVVIFIFS